MPGRITELAALTGATAATTDLIETVDISDTSMAATGTNKKMSLSDLATFVAVNGGSAPTGTKLSALTAIAGGVLTGTDTIEVLDVSDTTMAASGTNKRTTLADVQTYLNAVSRAGDTMVGTLTIPNGTLAGHAVNKSQLDGGMDDRVAVAGDVMTGPLGMGTQQIYGLATGTSNDHAVNKGQMDTAVATKQPLDTDLTTIAGLTATTDNVIQSVAGAWASRTPAQAKTALAIASTDVSGLGVLATAAVPISVAQGGSGRATDTSAYGLIAAGTTATGAHQTVAPAASGFLKTTSATVLPAWAAIASTDVSGLGSLATKSTIASADITDGVVSNADLTTMATQTIKGRTTAGTGAPEDLTITQARTMLGVFDNAGPMFNFSWDTTTTAGTSTNGIRANNATLASATVIYINYTPKSSVDLKTRILAGTAGDRIYIQDRLNSANYRVYELTAAPTDATTYASIPVVHRSGGGSFTNALDIVAGFSSPSMTISTVAPTSPSVNDLWVDTT